VNTETSNFSVQVDHSKSQLTYDKLSLKGAWSRHMTHFRFLVPLKYLWNNWSLVGHVKY